MDGNHMLHTPHSLILEDRKRLSVSGVQDVDCFDEETVVLYTNMGKLVIHGKNLHVNSLNVDTGDFLLEGDIGSLQYAEKQMGKKGFFSAVFR